MRIVPAMPLWQLREVYGDSEMMQGPVVAEKGTRVKGSRNERARSSTAAGVRQTEVWIGAAQGGREEERGRRGGKGT